MSYLLEPQHCVIYSSICVCKIRRLFLFRLFDSTVNQQFKIFSQKQTSLKWENTTTVGTTTKPSKASVIDATKITTIRDQVAITKAGRTLVTNNLSISVATRTEIQAVGMVAGTIKIWYNSKATGQGTIEISNKELQPDTSLSKSKGITQATGQAEDKEKLIEGLSCNALRMCVVGSRC